MHFFQCSLFLSGSPPHFIWDVIGLLNVLLYSTGCICFPYSKLKASQRLMLIFEFNNKPSSVFGILLNLNCQDSPITTNSD